MGYIYIDTSALIAMSDKNDKNHERAVSYFKIMDINTPFTFDSDFQTHGFEMLPT